MDNRKNGSYERSMSVLENQDANGVYTLQSGLGDSIFETRTFTGINFQDGLARGDYSMVDIGQLCSDSFYTSAANTLRSGRNYYYTVEATLSNGETVNLNEHFLGEERSIFTYTPAE